ncbi:MAG TPA: SusD/RagB family nutrient-binding outer membrane lipoprotein, partial [Ferruginibacter sp.]|nr:SusD/RagB family nutrient-binding outer membrane lipoprotein [Ferruginibacter sp.]
KRFPGANEYAAVEFRSAISDGVITSNADNVKLVFPGGLFKNPYWSDHDGQRDNGESTQIFDMLSDLGDGRQAAFGSSSVPVPHGLKEASINAWIKANINWSRILADNQRQETSPVYIMTASQLYMARSEAAFRGWTGPGAPDLTGENSVDLLNQGIDASFTQWGIALPPASYYTNQPHSLQKIVEQAFLASFPNGRAGWNIYRRTGFPVLTAAPDPLNAAHTTIPRRYTFTSSEYSLSPEGVASAITGLVPAADTQEARIWWDQ